MRLAMFVGLSVACAATVHGQVPAALPPAPGDSLRVPGRVAALLQMAELEPTLPRTRALRDVIRVIYEHTVPAGTAQAPNPRRERVVDYLKTLSAFERVAASIRPATPVLSQAENKDIRRQLENLAEAIGCTLERRSRVYSMEIDSGSQPARRREHLQLAGLDIEGLLKTLNGGGTVGLSLPSDDVPMPMPWAVWVTILEVPNELGGSALTAILSGRSAALLYYGLLGVDATTRLFLAARPDLLKTILTSDRVAVMASYGRSLRVANGRVQVPGGAAAEPQWEAVVGEPVTKPERFIAEVLGKDGGRLALLYDAVMFLDPDHQAFALGLADKDRATRVANFGRLYDVSTLALTGWEPALRPFSRNRFDVPQLLALTPVGAAGRLGEVASSRLWRKAFAGADIPTNPADLLNGSEPDVPVTAAGIVDIIAGSSSRWERVWPWFFALRVFDRASRAQLPDVLVTIRGFQPYGVLVATLDRLDVRDPAVYAAAVRSADRLSRIADRQRAETAMALFQGGLALVERARLSRVLDVASTTAVVRALCALPMTEDGEYLGAVGTWVSSVYLPAVANGVSVIWEASDETPAESLVIAAFAGRALSMADSPNLGVILEELPYVIDPGGADRARLQAVRRKQNGVSLDAVLALGRAAAAPVASGVTVDDVPAMAASVERTALALRKTGSGNDSAGFDAESLFKSVDSAVADMLKIKKPKDISKLFRIVEPVKRASDVLLGQAMLSLAYAPHLGDPDGPALLAGDPCVRHDWGLQLAVVDPLVPSPWRAPTEDRTGGGWHMQGSVLGLDITLAPQVLRRVVSDRVPAPPTIHAADQTAVTESVVLAVAFDYTDADRESLVSALRRGRARVALARAQPSLWPALSEQGDIRDVRRELVAWAMVHEPDRVPEFISLAEVVRMGQLAETPLGHLDVWGTSGRAFDGRWSLRYPSTQPLELLAGRRGGALVATLVPDLTLAIAEALFERGLPAVLTRAVLAAAAQDYIDELRQSYEDDWYAMIAQVPMVVPRIDEYVAALTVGGSLVPVARQP